MLFSQSWAKGPAGTNEDDFSDAMVDPKLLEGDVAESWQMPTVGTFVYQIRQGVHYGLNPNSEASRLVNGRVLTADDVVYSIQRDFNEPLSGPRTGIPEAVRAASISKTGPWEVTLKAPVDTWRAGFYFLWSSRLYVPEVVNKYGDMNNWRNSVGAGPFMLNDYVPGSQAVLVKNPNYYMKETAGPGNGNQLPYVDSVRLLIIPDVSTRMAALRTGKIDLAQLVGAEDAKSVKQTAPRLNIARHRVPFPLGISLRLDKAELPYKDIKVRQALTMATDFDTIVNQYHKGDAVKMSWPVGPTKSQEGAYWPFETLPDSVKALYTYNPEKAKQLLKEAGYPNGFKSKLVLQNTAAVIDLASIVKDQWAKVGVELELQTKDTGTYNSISVTRSYEDMIFKGLPVDTNNIVFMSTFSSEGQWNISFVKDQKIADLNAEMQKYIFVDQPKVKQLFHDQVPYMLEQAWLVPIPSAFQFAVWQPWVKGYYVQGVGALGTWMNWPPHAWIDQELKKSLGF
jgi:peptide/nickel transport system substrate-binding protein